ncbi:hypothetical protein NKG05_14360 [Oerskovia sp. M15]
MIGAGIWSDEWAAGLGDGSIATIVGAAWFSGILKDSAAASAGTGQWPSSPVEGGRRQDRQRGRQPLRGPQGLRRPRGRVDRGQLAQHRPGLGRHAHRGWRDLPASVSGLESDLLSSGDDYFGGQVIGDVFKTASSQVDVEWAWGPGVSTLVGTLATGMKQAYAKEGGATVETALMGAREATESELTQQGIAVNE